MSRDHLHQSISVGSDIGARSCAAATMAQCLSAALFLLAAHPVCAQRLSVRHYDVSDGLAYSHVRTIHQDHKGYIWFGTPEGLSRFDGYRFTNYGESDGLGHRIINDIAEDRQGRLWVATMGGVSRLIDDPREISSSHQSAPMPGVSGKFINFHLSESPWENRVNALLFDAHDNLWIYTPIAVYRTAAGQDRDLKFERVWLEHIRQTFPPNTPALVDRHGRLWFGIRNELLEVELIEGKIIKYGPDDVVGCHAVVAVVEDRQGRLLVANMYEVFEFIAPSDAWSRGQWRRYPLTLTPDQRLTAMVVDATGALWIGTSNGLIKYRDGKQTLYTRAQGLSGNSILSLAEDRDGNLWVGVQGAGVCKLTGELIDSIIRTEGLPDQNVMRVIEDRRGRIYATVRNGGFVEIVEGRVSSVPGSRVLPFSASIPFQDSRGNWWMHNAEDLFHFAGPNLQLRRGRKLSPIDGIPVARGISHSFFHEDPFGKLWLRYGMGLYQLDLGQKERAVFERILFEPILPKVYSIMSDRAGTLWLGGVEMLARFMNGRLDVLQPGEGLPEVNPRAFFQDSRGWLWIGLYYKGVSVTKDPSAENLKFVNYSSQTGLASDTVRSITEDDAGRIYFGTGKGLDQFDPMTGRIRHFDVRDGLAGAEINHCIKDRHGNIWVATPLGLSKFTPRAERIVDRPLPIYFSRVQVAGENLPLAGAGAQRIPKIEISSSQNSLLIEYVALSFQGEQRLRYQYKLEGVDADWSQPSDGRSVNYARLAPGSYQFLARAINQEGVMSAEPAVFQFRILPPIWQRWWFVSLSVIGVALTALAFYRSRIRRVVELERVRTRIATDLHDDIGSSLSQIAILSEVTRQRLGKEQSVAGESLAQIANTSRDLVDSMSDIVWAINPLRDRASDLTQRMREFAGDIFTASEIEFNFCAPYGGLEVRLDADVRRQIYLIFKEAVNNAARHSQCTRVEIQFDVAQGRLLLCVRDNGRGFDPKGDAATSRNGNGLASMRERARALGGEIEIISQANLGTDVKLDLPLIPRDGSRWRGYLPM